MAQSAAPAIKHVETAADLPPQLRNNVAVLDAPNPAAPGGKTKVFLLAMSHVSQRSLDDVRALIRATRPEVVAVELCKDRLSLLVDVENPNQVRDVWHSRKVAVMGLPTDKAEWPSAAQLLPMLRSRPGRPVSAQDIEADVITLLSTGLFKSVRPACANGTMDDAPEFVATVGPDGEPVVKLVPPLGSINFMTQERVLPAVTRLDVRVDSSLKHLPLFTSDLEAAAAAAVADCAAGAPAVSAYLKVRRELMRIVGVPCVVVFSGVETGRAEVSLRAPKATDGLYLSGLEGSAADGEGAGIESFQPMRNPFKLSPRMLLPAEALERLTGGANGWKAAAGSDNSTGAHSAALPPCASTFTAWSEQQMAEMPRPELPSEPIADVFGDWVTSQFAKQQSKAGRKLGVAPGAAWRVALEAATEVGTQQFLLNDMPARLTQRKLADGMLAASAGRLIGAAALLAAAAAAAAGAAPDDLLPQAFDAGAAGAAAATAAALLWPIVAPLLEVARFADLSPEQIEDAVAVKQPIDQGDLSQPLKLYGEDALLDWPGAMDAIIRQRDAFMAKALAAAATARPGASPAFIRDVAEGQSVWRYMMPAGSPPESAPAGMGDGAFDPLPAPRSVVAIVGSAHVRGMVRDWKQHVDSQDVAELLKV